MTKTLGEFITEAQAIKKLGISRATFRRLLDAKQFAPRYRLSPGRVAFKISEVENWIESRREISGGAA